MEQILSMGAIKSNFKKERVVAGNVLVINVLPKDTFEDCSIKGSIHMPFEDLGEYALNLTKDQKIVVYCASYMCSASRKAWHILNDLHFKNIWAYEGGMAEWRQKGYPSEGACQKEYLAQTYEKHDGEGRVREISAEDLKKLMEESK